MSAGILQTAEIGDLPLDSGATLENAFLTYRVYGEQAANGGNVILIPTWYSGRSEDFAPRGVIGPGCPFDSNEYCIIVVDAFANGCSSSPSNSETQAGADFPAVGFRDMVRAQQRLLTEQLGIEHIHLVSGMSMGAIQTFEWMMLFPDYADRFLAIQGSPWMTSYDLVLFRAIQDALVAGTDGAMTVDQAARLYASLNVLTAWTPDFLVANVDADAADEFVSRVQADSRLDNTLALYDLLMQTRAFIGHDIRKGVDDFDSAVTRLGNLQVGIVVARKDMLVNPTPSVELAESAGLPLTCIDDDSAHMCYEQGSNPGIAGLASLVRDFLA